MYRICYKGKFESPYTKLKPCAPLRWERMKFNPFAPFSDVLRGQRKGALGANGLNIAAFSTSEHSVHNLMKTWIPLKIISV